MRSWINLTETLDSPIHLEWTYERINSPFGYAIATFQVAGHSYLVRFQHGGLEPIFISDVWSISFRRETGGYDREHDSKPGDVLDVFSGVIASIKEFVSTASPPALGFSGDKGQGQARFYGKLIKRFSGDLASMGLTHELFDYVDHQYVLIYPTGEDPARLSEFKLKKAY